MKCKVIGKTYTVEFVSQESLPNDYGECIDTQQIIRVRTDLHKETQADVLLHELVHAVDFAVNTKLTERQVHAIATGLLGVFFDNPEILEWIQEQRRHTLGNE